MTLEFEHRLLRFVFMYLFRHLRVTITNQTITSLIRTNKIIKQLLYKKLQDVSTEREKLQGKIKEYNYSTVACNSATNGKSQIHWSNNTSILSLGWNGSYSEIMLRAEKSVFSVSCTHVRMVVRCVLCLTLILMGLSQIKAHELYLPNKKIKTKFRKVEVPGIQECIEACNLDRRCGALAMDGHAQCFIEDSTGRVTPESIRDLSIMVKSSERRCKERCPSDFITLGLTRGCYYPVLNETLNWEAAEAASRKLELRAHLIRIRNQKAKLVISFGKHKIIMMARTNTSRQLNSRSLGFFNGIHDIFFLSFASIWKSSFKK